MFRSFPQLETYYWVARLGSFRGAAEQLGVTQPSVSIRIKEMEAEAGGTLFIRTSHGVRLTDRGRSIFDHVERIMLLLSDLDGRVRNVGPLRGLLRFGVPDSFAMCCLPAFMGIIEEEHPDLNVSTVVENSRSLTQRLEEGILDLAVLAGPETDGFQRVPLGHQKLSWVANAKDVLADRSLGTLGPEHLCRRQILTNPSPSPTFSILMDWFSSHGTMPRRINTCNSIAAIEKIAVWGKSVSVLPTCVIQGEIDRGTVIELDVEPALPRQPVSAVFPKGIVNRAIPEMVKVIQRTIEGSRFVEPPTPDETRSD